MSAHTHTTLVDGCYRCDLNRDEIAAYADELRVTTRGVVHDPDCTFVNGPASNAQDWNGSNRFTTDRACSRCLPDGLPINVQAQR